MNKRQGVLIGIALVLIFTGIALATTSASPDVEIYAFDQNPAGSDEGNEWFTLHNPSNESVDIGNWVLETADYPNSLLGILPAIFMAIGLTLLFTSLLLEIFNLFKLKSTNKKRKKLITERKKSALIRLSPGMHYSKVDEQAELTYIKALEDTIASQAYNLELWERFFHLIFSIGAIFFSSGLALWCFLHS